MTETEMPQPKQIELTYLIPTYNRKEAVLKLLSELEPVMGVCEILLVDESSDDTSGAVLDAYGSRIRVIHNDARLGLPHPVNIGVDAAKYRNVFLLTDDAHIVGDPVAFSEKICQYLSEKGAMVGVRVLDRVSGRFDHRKLKKIAWWTMGQTFPEAGEVSRYADFVSFFAFDRQRVSEREDPGFEAGFRAESDLQLRARRRGERLYYAADLELIHDEMHGGADRTGTRKVKNHAYFVHKHFRLTWWPKLQLYRFYLALFG